jgi:UDP-N-acetylmuramyl tripeptide synthase
VRGRLDRVAQRRKALDAQALEGTDRQGPATIQEMSRNQDPNGDARTSTPLKVVAVQAGRATRWLSRRTGRGGTSLPGVVAQRIHPGLAADLAAGIANGCVLVTGTNGKTTTTRMIADILRRAGFDPITNREGSNMMGGITTTLLASSGWSGRVGRSAPAIGLFEVDEGFLPHAIRELRPRVVLINNLFRDQLDRYFEVDFVASIWARTLAQLPASTVLILNADDPVVAYLGTALRNPVLYYGIDDARWGQQRLQRSADARQCPRCTADLQYDVCFYAHLGHYSCPACGWRRPEPQISATSVEMDGLRGSTVSVESPSGPFKLEVPLPGIYNVYNAVAAAATSSSLKIEPAAVREAIAKATGAFGRLETVDVDGRRVALAMVKNPSSFDQLLEVLLRDRESLRLMIALNDLTQDSRDVSWIWDVGLERLRDHLEWIIASGHRASDLALRLKYAEVVNGADGQRPELETIPDLVRAFDEALRKTPSGSELFIVATYSAMWAIRDSLVHRGHLVPFWQT